MRKSGAGKPVLLLTATIAVGDLIYLKRKDLRLRINDYATALRKWEKVEALFDRIVFAENSNHDLTALKREVGRPLEWVEIVQFDGNTFPKELGKGYGEYSTVDYAVRNSASLANSDFFIVTAGRYFISNVVSIVNSLDWNFDVCCNFGKNLTMVDTNFVVLKTSVYNDYFMGCYQHMNDSESVYSEHILANIVREQISHGLHWRPLPHMLIIDGIMGTRNQAYDRNRIRHLYNDHCFSRVNKVFKNQ